MKLAERERELVDAWPVPVAGRVVGWRVRWTHKREKVAGLVILLGEREIAALRANRPLTHVAINGNPLELQAVTTEQIRASDPRDPPRDIPALWVRAVDVAIEGEPGTVLGVESDDIASRSANRNQITVRVADSLRSAALVARGDVAVTYLGGAMRARAYTSHRHWGRSEYIAITDPSPDLGAVEITNVSTAWLDGSRVLKEQHQ